MLFPTITFAAFFMVVWPSSWTVARWPKVRQVLLLAASWTFYAYWDARFLALVAGSIVVNHGAARALWKMRARPAHARLALWAGVLAHLGILGWYKYYGFFAATLASALDRVGVPVEPAIVETVLPLGISFFTFQAISHLVEVHRGVTEPGSLLEVATWLSFFLTIASGPITRASEFFPQLREQAEARIEARRAFALILRGLFKKMVLASYLATAVADDVFANPSRHSGVEVLVGVYAYAAQLYLDFSGYVDIAIGCALLLGIRLPENFNAPYAAHSVTEFWNRWHITLSRWLRDFVFTPLMLRSRRTTAATCRNLLIVMLLAGLWHGAAWTFVAFGAVHGTALVVERLVREIRRHHVAPALPPRRSRRVLQQVLTFHVVCLGWVFFRAESLAGAFEVLRQLGAGVSPTPAVTALLVAVIASVLTAQALSPRVLGAIRAAGARARPASVAIAAAAALVLIDVLGPEGVPPFLYFGF